MKQLKGIGASSGIGIAKVFILQTPEFKINNNKINDVEKEINLVRKVLNATEQNLSEVRNIALKKIGKQKAEIFDAHIQIVKDPELVNQVIELISKNHYNGAYALNEVFKKFHEMFLAMDNNYFQERASDVKDVWNKTLSFFLNIPFPDLLSINSEVIIVAHDLTPSQTAMLDKKYVKGFVTDVGGKTSHAAIMARTMEIPAVLGLNNVTSTIKENDVVAIDGEQGVIEINPNDTTSWNQKIKDYQMTQNDLKKYTFKKAVTIDGHHVEIEANIGKPEDADILSEYGAEGIGLFRSEFLYMEATDWPDENQQFESYKYVLAKYPDQRVIVRTLDIGGDKKLPYFTFDHEDNPFLGYRAIRFCLDRKDIFKTQLKALLKASVFGKLGIMFPMICSVVELLDAKKLLDDCKKELDKENISYSSDILIGMMIEIPSSAILSEKFAKYVDFFSIGTNDLIQYSFAIDRMSQKISYLYEPNNPALLRMIKLTIEGAKIHNVKVAMCGEMANDCLSVPILLGLANKGLDALSMTCSAIPKIKKLISSLNYQECIKLASEAIEKETTKEVNDLVTEFLKKKNLF